MADDPIATNAPESKSSKPVRIIGTLVILALVIAVILLALGVFNFEQRGFFGS